MNKKVIVNNNEYEFINNSRGNRSGFVHETKLYKNSMLLATNKVQYYNRTWEVYTYQTVMKGCVSGLMNSLKEEFKTDYKELHGIKRLTASKAEKMLAELENMPEYKELKELYNFLYKDIKKQNYTWRCKL